MEIKQHSGPFVEDTFKVDSVDKYGKKFQRVSRIEGNLEVSKLNVQVDINTELYPIKEGDYYSFILTPTLSQVGAEDKGVYNPQELKNTMIDRCEYCMYGKVFKIQEMPQNKLSICISYGGLLMELKGSSQPIQMIEIDTRLYFLLKKL